MKLITKEIEKLINKYPIYSQQNKGTDAVCIVKFFNPCGIGTWIATEANLLEDGDIEFFGIVDLYTREWGYFLLSQLTEIKSPYGLSIEREIYSSGKKVYEII